MASWLDKFHNIVDMVHMCAMLVKCGFDDMLIVVKSEMICCCCSRQCGPLVPGTWYQVPEYRIAIVVSMYDILVNDASYMY